MRIQFVFMFLLMCVGSTELFGQDNLTMADRAARIINRQNLTKSDVLSARDTILLALDNEQEMKDPYAWLVKGFIFKEMFKVVDDSSTTSVNREIAVDAIEECMSLDKAHLYSEECIKVLDFIAKSYFNHSAYVTLSGDVASFRQSEELYNKSRKVRRLMDPTADLTEWDISFEMNKAKAFTKMYEKDVVHNVEYINQAIESFKVALALDSNIHEANFNIATAYYNQGVYKVRRINSNTDFDSLIVIQDQCIQLFLKAQPYMMKAYELRPRHKDTLRGLWYINRALSNDEQAEFYRSELERRIQDGTIEEGNLQGQK